MNTPTYAVLNCHATQILGLYTNLTEAQQAANHYGNCSFPYKLTPTEQKNLTTN